MEIGCILGWDTVPMEAGQFVWELPLQLGDVSTSTTVWVDNDSYFLRLTRDGWMDGRNAG